MKKYFLSAFFFLHILALGMNQEATLGPTLVEKISTAVDDIATQRSLYTEFFLAKKDHANILNAICTHCSSNEPSQELLTNLYSTNNTVKSAVDFFAELIIDAIKKNNLKLNKNGELILQHSPTKEYPPFLQKFILRKTLESTEYASYKIVLDSHSDSITCFDVCSHANLAATASPENGIRIWNLKTAALMYTIINSVAITHICFRPDGSHFATAELSHDTQNKQSHTIKEWDTYTGKCTTTITPPTHITHIGKMGYLTEARFTILQTISNQNSLTQLNTWHIHEHVACYLGTMRVSGSITYDKHDVFNPAPYDQYLASTGFLGEQLQLIKKDCYRYALCSLAIDHSHSVDNFKKIQQAQLYTKLTEYERTLIDNKLQAKQKQLTQ